MTSWIKVKKSIIVLTLIITAMAVAIITEMIPMFTNVSSIPILEKWVSILETSSLIAVAFTIVFGGISLQLRTKLSKLQQDQINSLSYNVSQSNQKAQEANLKSSETEQQNIKLRIQYLELYETIAPRSVNEFELADKLKGFSGINVTLSYLHDPEPQNFADQLSKTFSLLRWRTTGADIVQTGNLPVGITITASDTSLANVIQQAFTDFKIVSNVILQPSLDPTNVEIFIGLKPSKFLKNTTK